MAYINVHIGTLFQIIAQTQYPFGIEVAAPLRRKK
jgi:hypothetical protein